MRLLNRVLFTFLMLFCALLSVTQAGSLYTAPLSGTHGDVVQCEVTNPTDEAVDVTVTLYEQTAGPVGNEVITVPPHGILGMGNEPQVYSIYYCQFTVSKKSKIRAIMWIIGLSGEITSTAEAR